jgi:hypothetical protein
VIGLHLVYRCLPDPVQVAKMRYALGGRNSLLVAWYVSVHTSLRQRLVAWHRKRLKQLDSSFRYADASRQLINAREKARQQGIGPLDPRYPDIDDFLT